MYNDLFTIGPLTIHGYGLMIGIGVLAAFLVASKRAPKHGLSSDVVYTMGIWAMIFGFIGAKLMYLLVELPAFIENPWRVLSGSGFVVYGGIIGGALAAFVYCRVKKHNFAAYFDLVMPSIALAQGFGRVGCFLAGCCYGVETGSILGVVFPATSFAPSGVPLLPTQLFSAGGDFLLAAVLILYARRKPKHGTVGALYLILYSVGRFIIEYFRADGRGNVGVLSTSQFISIFTLALGVIMFFIARRAREREQAVETSCGAVVYTETENGRLYVLIENESGCGFPKGHIEAGENERDTALREIAEETGVSAELFEDFRKEVEYVMPNGLQKRVVYFAGRINDGVPHANPPEITAVQLLPYDLALEALTFDNIRELLSDADAWLTARDLPED